MKRSNWVRLIAVILIISMLAAPVSAAPNRGNDGVRTNGAFGIIVDFIRDIIRDIFDDWFDKPGEEEPTPTTPVNPTTPTPTQPGETEPEETDPTEPTEPIETTAPTEPTEPEQEKVETVLNLVEGHSNTENGHLLRGDTYTLSQVVTQQAQQPQVAPYALRSASMNANAVNVLSAEADAANVLLAEADAENQVNIYLATGGTYTFTVDGDVSGNYSNDKVNVTTQVATESSTTANRATPASGLENGDYLIISADQLFKGNRAVLLNSTTGSLLGFSNNVTVSDDKATVTDFANVKDSMVWTLAIDSTDASGNHSVSLTNPNGKNLYANGSGDGSAVTVSDSSRELTLERGDNYTSDLRKNGWRVKFTISSFFSSASTYLNYTGGGAKTYNLANDDGNHWYFYKISETTTSTTTVTLTASNTAGVTTVEIGGVTYRITITDPNDTSRDIPVAVLTPTAGESQNGEGPERVLDDDASTLWHTTYSGTDRSTHWIQFQLSEDYLVDGLRYLPRSSGGDNGIITQYQIQVSDDGNTFRTVASGNWENNSSWKAANFTAVNAKYVRLVSVNAITDQSNIFASAAEIRLTGTKLIAEQVDLGLKVIPRYMTNRLEWNAEDGVTYTVQRSIDNVNWFNIGTASTGDFLDENAARGTQYYYRVTTKYTYTDSVQGIATGMNALKEIAVLFYEGNDSTTFDGTNKVVIADGDKAAKLNALASGTIVYKADFADLNGTQPVLGTNNSLYVGSSGDHFRMELGGSFKGTFNNTTLALDNANTDEDNTAGVVYDDSNGHWAMCARGANVYTTDLDENVFGLLTGVNASTYYAGGNNANGFRGTINYIMILDEVLTDAELKALTKANENHNEEKPAEPIHLVYMPVTMFNYDMDTMNDMTNSMYEDGSTLYSGIHFSNGTPAGKDTVTYATTAHTGEYTNGQYVIQNYLMKDYSQPSWLTCSLEGEKGITATSNQADAAIWTLTRRPGANVFTLTTEIDGTTYYMTMGNETSGVTTEYSEITLVYYTHSNAGIQITKDGYYLGHSEGNLFCGNTNSTSTSNGMGFFPVAEDGTIGDTARNVTTINGAVTSGFSRWNWWSYLEDGNAAQNKFFAELVQHELDENDDIVFNVIEPGIFKTGTGENIADKKVYTNVGLPFKLSDKGVYSFDSDYNGVYFADTNGDGSSDPASGTETESYKLTYEPGSPQGWEGMRYGDGSSQLWAPFNTNTNDTGEGQIDYHFGMRADIPFSMTPNGCVNSNDNSSTPITFTFSGDDDVWIFIDGHLVIDLGGIHNRIGATINFADNTITYFLPESNENNSDLGCYNDRTRYPVTVDKDGKQTITVKLYNDADGEGPLGKTRTEFASQENHTMSIFYLERGKGTSNCHIEFNMPMLDTLLVTKDATKSWSAEQDEKDGDGDGTLPLTPAEQERVDNLRFGFTLYKMDGAYLDDNGDPIEGVAPDFHPVAGTNFYVQDKDGNIVGHGTTDANGKFSLQNGQTAKFITDMPRTGVTYYVVEDVTFDGFLTPDYLYAGTAANGFNYNGMGLKKDGSGEVEVQKGHVGDAKLMGEHELPMAEPGQFAENRSYIITVKGSIEANDSLEFICTNYLEHNDKPVVAHANEDIIVIDYGLPVQIDPLANDIIRGEHVHSVDIVNVQIGDYDFHVKEDGTIDPAQLQELADNETTFEGHSGTFTLSDSRDTFDYVLNKQLTEVEVLTYLIKATAPISEYSSELVSTYSQAKLYVVPATIMYYEENFNNLVSYSGTGSWSGKAPGSETEMLGEQRDEAYVSAYQEPGVVGTIGDSTYGSDVAYLNDSGDSNGTSFRFDTTNGYVRFQYTFTGTGTSFFARTSATTGYMQVLLFNADSEPVAGNQIETYYRDTYFFKGPDDYTKTHDDDPLYNIPVYTNDDLPYGTYTVLVTVAKKGTKAAGPMNPEKNNMKYSMHEFYLDGIRVMQPLNGVYETNAETGENEAIPNDRLEPLTQKALGAYATDGESNLEITTLRRKILEDFTPEYDAENGATEPNWPFAVLTDTNKQIVKASEYESIGPKEEVYLSGVNDTLGISNAQTVSFSLKYWQPDGLKVYMGMKAPFGSATVKIGDQSRDLLNATDCYYDVTEYASRITEYEQLCDEIGQPLYTDPSGKLVYESFEDGACYYVDDHTAVPQDTELDPVDDETKPICYIDTYTFEAVRDIVSLTNIKVVGTYQFTIIEDHEENIDITDPGTEEGGDGNNNIDQEVTE